MTTINLTDALRQQYIDLFTSCVIRSNRVAEVESLIDRLLSNRDRYNAIGSKLQIPWSFIAVIHNMVSGQDFGCHLHNVAHCPPGPYRSRPAGQKPGIHPSPGKRAPTMR